MNPTLLAGLRSLGIAVSFCAAALAQIPFTTGNLVLVRVGDGAAALTNAATPVFVEEYTPAGALVQSIPMPTVASGTNQRLLMSGTATSEGFLNLSTNGLFLMLGGYDAAPGTASIATSVNPGVARVIARIDPAGTVDTSTALTDAFSGRNLRSVASDDGFRYWAAGSGEGVRFVPITGSTTSVSLGNNPLNSRVLQVYNGQVYGSAASTTYHGLFKVGDGLPTVTAVGALEPGFSASSGPSIYDYYFASPTTVYVADDRTSNAISGVPNGGIFRFDYNFGLATWVYSYQLSLGSSTGCRGLSGFRQNGVTTLWGTAVTSSGATSLVSIVDNGPTSTPTTLAVAPPNTAFRGVRFYGQPTTLVRFPAGCGAMDIQVTGNAQLGTEIVTTFKNSVYGYSVLGFGDQLVLANLCPACMQFHNWFVYVIGNNLTLTLPNSPTILGVVLYMQGLDYLAPNGCTLPEAFTFTDGYAFTVQ
ncbi:MAG: hypothetical protein U1F60_12810 [Planctomycetota bacterium]